MIVYRAVKYRELSKYLQGKKYEPAYGTTGINTFIYDSECDYVHFFIFPYCAEYFAKRSPYTKAVITYDLEDEYLEKYFGYGYYGNLIPDKYTPVPEIAIPNYLFDINNIKTIDDIDSFCDTCKDDAFNNYLDNLDKDYCADYTLGTFNNEKDMYSILEVPKEKIIKRR